MTHPANCACDMFVHPAPITNLPGLNAIAYRVGDYTSFRRALLLSLPHERELANWRPSATSDLAVQMIEWWAYLADVLTFYNQRAANQDYLRTADLDQSVKRIIRLLGYRPRPGVGATARLAALSSSKKPFTLFKGFAVQSKPGPGQQPQIFELDADTIVQPLDAVSADPSPASAGLGTDGSVIVKGTITSVKQGDLMLVIEKGWNGSTANYAAPTVAMVRAETDTRGAGTTRITFTAPLALPDGASASSYQLLRSAQTTRIWQYTPADTALRSNSQDETGSVALESLARQVNPGDLLLFDGGSGPGIVVSVTSYAEEIWYANSAADPPTLPPADANTPGIPILHSVLGFRPAYQESPDRSKLVIRCGWQSVGQLLPTASATFVASSTEFIAVKPPDFHTGSAPVLIEDANGDGESATGFVGQDSTRMQLSDVAQQSPTLVAPANVLFNLLGMSRGKTIRNEVLGSGDASLVSQEFVLKHSPLTYLLSADTSVGGNYASTLRVWVNGIEWSEAPSFYGRTPTDPIFVTREDDDGHTHVSFGDGVNGARLPTGTSNVVATYRFGSGADAPSAGKLTSIVSPEPGLTAVRNPVGAGGGADADPASQIRRYAPMSVLTFGRAVSGQDYESIAASAPGVARAHVYWGLDALQQRTSVSVYVGDDDAAVHAARIALKGDADPNRPITVKLATAVALQVALTVVIDPRFIADTVRASVEHGLLDPRTGLFGSGRIGVGEAIYASQIHDRCLSSPGVRAVHNLRVNASLLAGTGHRLDPGEGAYLSVDASALTVTPEVASHAR